MIRALIDAAVKLIVWAVYQAYRAEGLNALFLFMPARFIAPTLRRYGATIGERVEMHSPLLVHNASAQPGRHYSNLIIGDDCYFGREVFLDLKDQILIEDRVTISMRVTLITHTDAGKSEATARLAPSRAPIRLRHGAYIGAGAMILQGVEIGSASIVGAGAVVIRDLPANATGVGVPAQLIVGGKSA